MFFYKNLFRLGRISFPMLYICIYDVYLFIFLTFFISTFLSLYLHIYRYILNFISISISFILMSISIAKLLKEFVLYNRWSQYRLTISRVQLYVYNVHCTMYIYGLYLGFVCVQYPDPGSTRYFLQTRHLRLYWYIQRW